MPRYPARWPTVENLPDFVDKHSNAMPRVPVKAKYTKIYPTQSQQVFSLHLEMKENRQMFGKSLVARIFFASDMHKPLLPRSKSAKSSRKQNLKTVGKSRIAPTIVAADTDDLKQQPLKYMMMPHRVQVVRFLSVISPHVNHRILNWLRTHKPCTILPYCNLHNFNLPQAL